MTDTAHAAAIDAAYERWVNSDGRDWLFRHSDVWTLAAAYVEQRQRREKMDATPTIIRCPICWMALYDDAAKTSFCADHHPRAYDRNAIPEWAGSKAREMNT